MSVQYRVLGHRRLAAGAGRYASIAAALVLVPVTVAADKVAGAGDLLHAVAEKPQGAN